MNVDSSIILEKLRNKVLENPRIQINVYDENNERKKDDYNVIKSIMIDNHYEIVCAERKREDQIEYVTWERNISMDSYYYGHYFTEKEYNKAYRDLYNRVAELERRLMKSNSIEEWYYGGKTS